MRRIIITTVITAASAIGAAGTAGCSSSSTTADPAALPAASCGYALTHGVTASTQVLGTQRAGSLRCFVTAARHCTHASLLVIDVGVDTGTSDVFTITPAGTPASCAVTEASQWYSGNFGGSTSPVQATQCTVAAVTSKGVTLSCAGQPILIPAAVSRPAG